jgi:hypothetical protein
MTDSSTAINNAAATDICGRENLRAEGGAGEEAVRVLIEETLALAFGDLGNHTVSFDASLYYIDWKDLQLQLFSGGLGF